MNADVTAPLSSIRTAPRQETPVAGGVSRRAFVVTGLFCLAVPPALAATSRPLAAPPDTIDLSTPGQSIDFAFVDGAGTPRRIADYHGNVLVLNIWAPWCLPCRDEMPALDRLGRALSGQPIRVLPVSVDRRGHREVERFYSEEGISALPVLVGKPREVVDAIGEDRIPLTLILDAHGRELFRHKGAARWDDPGLIALLKGAACNC